MDMAKTNAASYTLVVDRRMEESDMIVRKKKFLEANMKKQLWDDAPEVQSFSAYARNVAGGIVAGQ